ncbi:MAG: NAD(+)/NADH kinase [bacterium]
MIIGVIPNTTKAGIFDVVNRLLLNLSKKKIDFLLSESLLKYSGSLKLKVDKSKFLEHGLLASKSDVVVSIGGDGTMLNTAYEARNSGSPVVGLNFGKLGFLAEVDVDNVTGLIDNIKDGNYSIEKRMALESFALPSNKRLYAINDIVIDKGGWPKMIELTVKVDNEYVATFAADGIIVATPTGSTGYSLSTGGPIISPQADVFVLSPISPHTLTMRPLVLDSRQKVSIEVKSMHTHVQVNCDGQRVYNFEPPFIIEILKSKKPLSLVHVPGNNYFRILREKLYWGLDLRNNNNSKKE